MLTRGKIGNLKPRTFLTHCEPTNLKQASAQPKWFEALQQEYNVLVAKNTWTRTTPSSHRKAICCKWVFKLKQNSNDTLNKYKAMLKEKGFNQQYGFEFHETFNPVVKLATIQVILTLALTHKWGVQQIDINNAFLNGTLLEEIYMHQPPGFEQENKALVCKLN